MKLSKYSWMLFKSAVLAVLILMTIGLIQLFVQIRAQGQIDINIGYPFHFFSFSVDGNQLSVTHPTGLFWNFLIFFPLTFLCNLIGDYFLKRILGLSSNENDLVDQ